MKILTKKLGTLSEHGLITPLVDAGTPLPAAIRQVFATQDDGQHALEIRLYAAATELQSNKKEDWAFLSSYLVRGIAPKPRGEARVGVFFGISEKESVIVTAFDLDTGAELTISTKDS